MTWLVPTKRNPEEILAEVLTTVRDISRRMETTGRAAWIGFRSAPSEETYPFEALQQRLRGFGADASGMRIMSIGDGTIKIALDQNLTQEQKRRIFAEVHRVGQDSKLPIEIVDPSGIPQVIGGVDEDEEGTT